VGTRDQEPLPGPCVHLLVACGVVVGLVGEVGIVIVVILLLLAWVASGVWVWDLHALVVVEKRRLGFAGGA
jgi:hypothetical protein